jgi:hypothetical protein
MNPWLFIELQLALLDNVIAAAGDLLIALSFWEI